MVKKALTIAGSDSGGGAGIQADLKTFHERNVFGMSAVTAVTAQNTLGVHGVHPIPVEMIYEQISRIEQDLTPDSIKTGMLFSEEIIEMIVFCAKQYDWDKLVVDPVMIAKGGASLLQSDAIQTIQRKLVPLSFLITPNLPECEILTNMETKTITSKKDAAKKLHDLGAKYVLLKGGHGMGDVLVDLLFDGKNFYEWESEKIKTKHTHGTGCTLSAAITAELAKGKDVVSAVEVGVRFIQNAIQHSLQLGSGNGPTNHWADRQVSVK
ncbi:phosphomethylpyrimidine kinase [Bacillus coahuilensis p1.1.43]|uniref:Hydroxymethylpyrimidine/phosphomethylpyrimidine kinase n=1 Tax=Bacillus coahuilensis p1.1.43 TaxID=1150625 RepID=A0A147K9B8_9BACI|nr:bifunctional hydroxymethylpyrimidine kinase/phosphomethylpyrimidine kinase [Bacillus coahuilensis]KUP06928.1 phosphomethylpyrimidine kinase [Bacillus coahuilensis p1.1.43]